MAMLYVERDESGKMVAITTIKSPSTRPLKTVMDAELIDFLHKNDDEDHLRLSLNISDSGLIRTIEDIINLLIEKKIIYFTELPAKAQERIVERRRLRERLSSDDLIVDDIL
jgi:hypothetical protein